MPSTSTKNAEAANYPFCTIEPNSGIVAVPDKRLDKLAEIWQTNKKTPAIVACPTLRWCRTAQAAWQRLPRAATTKGAAAEAAWLQQLADHLSAGKPARSFDFDEGDAEQQAVLHEMGLLSAKPVLYACNVGEDDLMEGIENNKYVPLVAARAKEEGARYIPICAKTEEDIADYSPEEKRRLFWLKWALKPAVWTTSSLPAMICWA